MSLNNILDSISASINNSVGSSNSTNLANQLFESAIPGYSPLYHFILQKFKFDITILLTISAGFGQHGSYIRVFIYGFVPWLRDIIHHSSIFANTILSETNQQIVWDAEGEGDEQINEKIKSKEVKGKIDTTVFLYFSNQSARSPPRYTLDYGGYCFWYQEKRFELRRIRETVANELGGKTTSESLKISCFGKSANPIKRFLRECQLSYLLGTGTNTSVWRPSAPNQRRLGGWKCWIPATNRPSRPIDTVALDPAKKWEILADINEYLKSATRLWYANRGIPYRRGYLFHGPAGNGKTSLAFALAGVFGLNIYVVSLMSPDMTEEDLELVFNALPPRCIVLLEDIDSAGLTRCDQKEYIRRRFV